MKTTSELCNAMTYARLIQTAWVVTPMVNISRLRAHALLDWCAATIINMNSKEVSTIQVKCSYQRDKQNFDV